MSSIYPSNIRTSWMQARMRFGIDQAETDEAKNVIRVASEADSSSQQRTSFGDVVVVGISR